MTAQTMDRPTWIKQVRHSVEMRYDTMLAPIYDDNWGGSISPSHQQFVLRLLDLCPPGGHILDAACGTGKYWSMILASGRTIHGTDQSQGMLARASAKHPDVPVEKLGLQEMRFQEAFDAALCLDAIELVFPEDWPLVLGNLHRAIKPASYLYFTVEIADDQDIENDFLASTKAGLPIVYGESVHLEAYHFYPTPAQVKDWLQLASFDLIEETVGDDYHHYLVKKVREHNDPEIL